MAVASCNSFTYYGSQRLYKPTNNKHKQRNSKMEQTLDDIDFITDEINDIKQNKSSHKRQTAKKQIKVRSSVEVAKDERNRIRQLHKDAIKRLKLQISIHKLQIKQAKTNYKLIKLNSK